MHILKHTANERAKVISAEEKSAQGVRELTQTQSRFQSIQRIFQNISFS